jgi:hypothetical protein
MQRRATKQILPDNPDIDEPCHKMGPREVNRDSIIPFVSTIWTIVKVVLILFIIFPFIDKIRHKDYFSKAVSLINELDIGCRPCICPENAFNTTVCEGDRKGSGF